MGNLNDNILDAKDWYRCRDTEWKYTTKTWNNIASVESNELFEPKWHFQMNAADYFLVWDINIICDGTPYPTNDPTLKPTSNPTVIPTLLPSNLPSIGPTYDPTIYPSTHPTIYPSNHPTTSSPTKSLSQNTLSVVIATQNTNDNEVEVQETESTYNEDDDVNDSVIESEVISLPQWLYIAISAFAVILCLTLCVVYKKYKKRQQKSDKFRMNANSVLSVSRIDG